MQTPPMLSAASERRLTPFCPTRANSALGGLIGGAINAIDSIVTQAVTGEADWAQVGLDFGIGFLQGATYASPLGKVGQAVAGGVISAVSYVAESAISETEVTFGGAVTSIANGAISSWRGGNGLNHKFKLSNVVNDTSKKLLRETRRMNQKAAIKKSISAITYRSNTLGNAFWSMGTKHAGGAITSHLQSGVKQILTNIHFGIFD